MTEEIKQALIEELKEYLKENIEHFEQKASMAWDRMDKSRAPLCLVYPAFDREISNKVEEWICDNIENEDLV